MVCGPEPYTLTDAPGSPPQITVEPAQRCMTAHGKDVTECMSISPRTWGEHSNKNSTVLLSGTYRTPRELGWHLLSSMPQLLIHPSELEGSTASLTTLLSEEISKEEVGQELMLDRLLDLLLVSILRSWLSKGAPGTPPWYQALRDPMVGRALELIQSSPTRPWTVAELAKTVGASRSVFARRFNDLVGRPPMACLIAWRLALAADLVRDSEVTLTTVAQKVGYNSAFAFSSAFKRTYGMSPQDYRDTDAQGLSALRSNMTAQSLVHNH